MKRVCHEFQRNCYPRAGTAADLLDRRIGSAPLSKDYWFQKRLVAINYALRRIRLVAVESRDPQVLRNHWALITTLVLVSSDAQHYFLEAAKLPIVSDFSRTIDEPSEDASTMPADET